MISKTTIGLAAGLCGTIFVGYCLYFDRKRRMDPNFVKKLKERRKAQKAALKKATSKSSIQLPDMKDHQAVQTFFLQQVQLGEELLGQGDVSGGIEHLAYAVSVCGQPSQLLQVFQQTLPSPVFTMLVQRLSDLSQVVMEAPTTSTTTCPTGGTSVLTEEDVE